MVILSEDKLDRLLYNNITCSAPSDGICLGSQPIDFGKIYRLKKFLPNFMG